MNQDTQETRSSVPRRSLRRHHVWRCQRRRLSEDRNQHYRDLTCPCWTDPKAMARFKEQPKRCSCFMCGNPRRHAGTRLAQQTHQERRAAMVDEWDEVSGEVYEAALG